MRPRVSTVCTYTDAGNAVDSAVKERRGINSIVIARIDFYIPGDLWLVIIQMRPGVASIYGFVDAAVLARGIEDQIAGGIAGKSVDAPAGSTVGIALRIEVRILRTDVFKGILFSIRRIRETMTERIIRTVGARDLDIRTVLDADTQAQIQIPTKLEIEVPIQRKAQSRKAEVKIEIQRRMVDLSDGEIPLSKVRINWTGQVLGDFHDLIDMTSVRRSCRKPISRVDKQTKARHVRASIQRTVARSEKVEYETLNKLRALVLCLFHEIAEWLNDARAYVTDEFRALGELVPDQWKFDSENFAVEQILNTAKERIEGVHRKEDIVEQAELAEVDIQDIRRNLQIGVDIKLVIRSRPQ